MATWIVGGAVLIIVGGIIWRMILGRKQGKGCCGDCGSCRMNCDARPR
jgi:hypothetical protein